LWLKYTFFLFITLYRAFNFVPSINGFHFFLDFFSTAYAAFHGWQLNFSFGAEFINHIQQQAARPSLSHPLGSSRFHRLKAVLKAFGFWFPGTEWHATTAESPRGNGQWRMANYWSGQKRHRIWETEPLSSVSVLRLQSFGPAVHIASLFGRHWFPISVI